MAGEASLEEDFGRYTMRYPSEDLAKTPFPFANGLVGIPWVNSLKKFCAVFFGFSEERIRMELFFVFTPKYPCLDKGNWEKRDRFSEIVGRTFGEFSPKGAFLPPRLPIPISISSFWGKDADRAGRCGWRCSFHQVWKRCRAAHCRKQSCAWGKAYLLQYTSLV